MVTNKTYKVEGMMCGNCEQKVNDALRFSRGVKQVKTDHAQGTLEMEYDDELITPEAIKSIVEGLGFKLHL